MIDFSTKFHQECKNIENSYKYIYQIDIFSFSLLSKRHERIEFVKYLKGALPFMNLLHSKFNKQKEKRIKDDLKSIDQNSSQQKLISIMQRCSTNFYLFLETLSFLLRTEWKDERFNQDLLLHSLMKGLSRMMIERDLFEKGIKNDCLEINEKQKQIFLEYGNSFELFDDTLIHLISNHQIKFPFKKYFLNEKDILEKFENLKNYNISVKYADFKIPNKFSTESKSLFSDLIFQDQDLLRAYLPSSAGEEKVGKRAILSSNREDYWKINIITDYFSEKQRVKAMRKKETISPFLQFTDPVFLRSKFLPFLHNKSNHYSQSSGKPNEGQLEIDPNQKLAFGSLEMREAIFELCRECTLFRSSLAFSIYKIFQAKRVLDFSSGWGKDLNFFQNIHNHQ